MNFKANNTSKFSAIAISEFISVDMTKKKEITIIERSQIGAILNEQGFQQTGCTDQSCAVAMGKILSARKIIIGTLNKTGNVYVITGKVVDVETGRVDAAETERCTKEDDFAPASKILAIKMTNKIAGTGYSLPVRTYRQDEERNKFFMGMMYQFGLYPGYKMPALVYDSSEGIYKFGGKGAEVFTHSLVMSAGYEFTQHFELKAEFGYMAAWNSAVSEFEFFAGGLSLNADDAKFETFDFTIFPMYKYPIGGFRLFVAPGIGYRISKIKANDDGYWLQVGSNTYGLKPLGHAFLLKFEIGTTVYISRFVELVFAFGIDGQVYSTYYKNVNVKQVSGSAASIDDYIGDSSNNAFVGCYIKAGFNVRIF